MKFIPGEHCFLENIQIQLREIKVFFVKLSEETLPICYRVRRLWLLSSMLGLSSKRIEKTWSESYLRESYAFSGLLERAADMWKKNSRILDSRPVVFFKCAAFNAHFLFQSRKCLLRPMRMRTQWLRRSTRSEQWSPFSSGLVAYRFYNVEFKGVEEKHSFPLWPGDHPCLRVAQVTLAMSI